jgi:hypothetical protein
MANTFKIEDGYVAEYDEYSCRLRSFCAYNGIKQLAVGNDFLAVLRPDGNIYQDRRV